jgi:excisionase family DNA binding protein
MSVLLTVDEAAFRLNVSPLTIRSWIRLRKIPFVKLGRAVRLDADTLDQWVTENTIPAQGRA